MPSPAQHHFCELIGLLDRFQYHKRSAGHPLPFLQINDGRGFLIIRLSFNNVEFFVETHCNASVQLPFSCRAGCPNAEVRQDVAKNFGLPHEKIWEKAALAHPVLRGIHTSCPAGPGDEGNGKFIIEKLFTIYLMASQQKVNFIKILCWQDLNF